MKFLTQHWRYICQICALLLPIYSYAQNETGIGDTITNVAKLKGDTVLVAKDSAQLLNKTSKKTKRLSTATKAALWAFVPAGGTLYNRQYWKTPVYGTVIVGLSVLSVQQYVQYRQYYKDYTHVLTNYASGIVDATDLNPIRENKQQALHNYNLFRNLTIASYAITIADSYVSNLLLHEENKQHSPLRAAYRSGVLPGLGQAYNRKYWKIPIIYAGFGALGYSIYFNGAQSQRYKEEYLARTRPTYGTTDDRLAPISTDNLLRIRAQYKRYYDLSIIVAALWYVINIADATVDGHLYKFDVTDDLSDNHVRIYPLLSTPQTPFATYSMAGGVGFSWTF